MPDLAANAEPPPAIAAVDCLTLWHEFDETLSRLMNTHRPHDVCELGGGRRPALSRAEVDRRGVRYVLLDADADELAAAPDWCDTIRADAASSDFAIEDRFDFAFSRMLAEHVTDGRRFHANVHRALRPGGVAFHFFPTMFTVPFVVNKLLPEVATRRILQRAQPRGLAKFPAHYRWTWGPTQGQLRRIESVGLEVLAYVGGFGHHYYRRIPPLDRAMQRVWELARERELYHVASYAYLVVRKPGGAVDQSRSAPAT